jgi:hypothetical protein
MKLLARYILLYEGSNEGPVAKTNMIFSYAQIRFNTFSFVLLVSYNYFYKIRPIRS